MQESKANCVYWLVYRRRSRKGVQRAQCQSTLGRRPQTGPNTCHKTGHKAGLVNQHEGEAVIGRQMWDYGSLHLFGKQRVAARRSATSRPSACSLEGFLTFRIRLQSKTLLVCLSHFAINDRDVTVFPYMCIYFVTIVTKEMEKKEILHHFTTGVYEPPPRSKLICARGLASCGPRTIELSETKLEGLQCANSSLWP